MSNKLQCATCKEWNVERPSRVFNVPFLCPDCLDYWLSHRTVLSDVDDYFELSKKEW